MGNKAVVVGSCHQCFFLIAERIPSIGETVLGHTFFSQFAGKGSNQALACFKLGGDVTLIERLGNDQYGQNGLEQYKKLGMNTNFIKLDNTIHSGIASIFIDDNGQNSIIVVPGANGKLSREDIDNAEEAFKQAYIAGFVFEVPLDTVEYAIKKAHLMGVKTFVDPAPVPTKSFNEDVFKYITYIKPNEHEASLLSGIKVVDIDSAVEAGRWFIEKGVNTTIITLGEKGSVLVTAELEKYFPSPKVNVLDTTAAGDIFAGALLAALLKEKSIEEAIEFANCAATISVTKPGATESIPTEEEVNKLLLTVKHP